MRAADTNVLLRLITGDDPAQELVVLRLLASERLYIPLTVAMETEWVLRSYYRMSKSDIAAAMLSLTELQGLAFEQSEAVRWASERLAHGAEFDDLIHIAAAVSGEADAFVTFDRGVPSDAGDASPLRIDLLPA